MGTSQIAGQCLGDATGLLTRKTKHPLRESYLPNDANAVPIGPTRRTLLHPAMMTCDHFFLATSMNTKIIGVIFVNSPISVPKTNPSTSTSAIHR